MSTQRARRRTATARWTGRNALGLLAITATTGLLASWAPAQTPGRDAASPSRGAAELSPALIRGIQHSLMQGGYAVRSADGVWGPDTAAALGEFQRVKGLPATGRPDARTLSALGIGPGSPAAKGPATAAGTDPAPRVRTPADLDRTTVRTIQQALARQGLEVGATDGNWGELTRSALGNFQRSRGLPASGEPDVHTLSALGLLPTTPGRAAPPTNGLLPELSALDPAAIRMIQQALSERGQDVGIDGMWGDRTEAALRAYQRTQGLEPLGAPDVHTLVALGLLPAGPPRATSSR